VRHTKDREIDEQVAAFGVNMRAARLHAGLSQVALSEATGLDRAAISFLERAERSPDLSTLVRIAGALGVTPAALLDGIGSTGARGVTPAALLDGIGSTGARASVPPAESGAHSEPASRLGANLRASRKHAGMSQEALAYEAEVDRAAISVYERGGRGPNLRTVLKLSRALQLCPAALFAGVG
jgi:transcriptional regulator with XRE-family HTH domain